MNDINQETDFLNLGFSFIKARVTSKWLFDGKMSGFLDGTGELNVIRALQQRRN